MALKHNSTLIPNQLTIIFRIFNTNSSFGSLNKKLLYYAVGILVRFYLYNISPSLTNACLVWSVVSNSIYEKLKIVLNY